jgi:hypothetical protein
MFNLVPGLLYLLLLLNQGRCLLYLIQFPCAPYKPFGFRDNLQDGCKFYAISIASRCNKLFRHCHGLFHKLYRDCFCLDIQLVLFPYYPFFLTVNLLRSLPKCSIDSLVFVPARFILACWRLVSGETNRRSRLNHFYLLFRCCFRCFDLFRKSFIKMFEYLFFFEYSYFNSPFITELNSS